MSLQITYHPDFNVFLGWSDGVTWYHKLWWEFNQVSDTTEYHQYSMNKDYTLLIYPEMSTKVLSSLKKSTNSLLSPARIRTMRF